MRDRILTPPAEDKPGANILVVEDDDAVAHLVETVLKTAGYQTNRVNDGVKALQVAGQLPFDLILSDVIMPNKSGPHMIRELREAGIMTPVVFISGYTHDRLKAHGFEPGSVALLRKPFSTNALLREVAEALSGLD